MSVAESCLQNPIIIQKILNHLSPDSMENLKLRIVNKSYDFGVLHHIRMTHRSIRMEVPGALDYRRRGEYGVPDYLLRQSGIPVRGRRILVNEHSVPPYRMLGYLKFLRIIANVKVQHLVMINLWAIVISYKEWKKKLHDELHQLLNKGTIKTLIGMHDVCGEYCEDCYYMARNASVYEHQPGLGFYLARMRSIYHYRKLIVDERLLRGSASNKSLDGTAGELLKTMLIRISPFLTCDQLCFKLSECPWESEERLPTEPIPLEVIQRMCDVWRPVSILIEYDHFPQNRQKRETWSSKGTFTPVRLDGLYQERVKRSVLFDEAYKGCENPDKKERKFSSVTVDMTNTERIYKEVVDGSIDRNDSYSNLIANVRMLFPTDKIVIIGSSSPTASSVFNKQCFENIVKSVWKNRGRMEVTIQHELPISLIDNNFVIGDSMDMLGRRLNCTLVPERLTSRNGFIGRTYRITDNINEKTLNLELFVPRKPLEFLKYFY